MSDEDWEEVCNEVEELWREERDFDDALKRADEERASKIIPSQEERIAELEEAIRVLADTVVVFWTSADFVRHSDSLYNARKNPIVCRAIDEARGAIK